MSKKSLSLGFLGGGLNSAVGNTHRIASQMDNRWVLRSGCFSRNKDININTADKWGVEESRVYYDWQTFLKLEKGNIDAVCILTPTNVHKEMVIRALNEGHAVICEKAMATTLEEADEICEAVKTNNVFFTATYNYTGYPMLRELRQMIIDGRLGSLSQIQIEMPQEGFARLDSLGNKPSPQEWRLRDGTVPTISLDLGIHLHHMVHFLSGESPIEVVADHDTFGFFNQVVDNVMCIARYTGNLKSQIWYSKSAIGHRNGLRVRVYGNKGSAEWFQMQPEKLEFCDIYGNYQIIDRASNVNVANELRYNRFKSGHPAGFIEAYANHYFDIADSLMEYKTTGKHSSPFVFDADRAREGLKMLQAISISAKDRCWQKI